jgi:hypothetical protein
MRPQNTTFTHFLQEMQVSWNTNFTITVSFKIVPTLRLRSNISELLLPVASLSSLAYGLPSLRDDSLTDDLAQKQPISHRKNICNTAFIHSHILQSTRLKPHATWRVWLLEIDIIQFQHFAVYFQYYVPVSLSDCSINALLTEPRPSLNQGGGGALHRARTRGTMQE